METVVRFMGKVTKRLTPEPGMADGCWEWNGFRKQRGGYGLFWVDGKAVSAHRWSYQTFVGPIPAGLALDHLCRNTRCVRPTHLEPVTTAENKQRWARTLTVCPSGHLKSEHMVRRRDGSSYCRACRQIARDKERRAS